LPRSHELRYWLYIPLILMPVNLRYVKQHYQTTSIATLLVVLTAYGVANTLLSPNSDLWTAHPASETTLRMAMPSAIAQALHDTGRYCTANDEELPFRYSSAVTGIPGLVSSIATDCQ
jgi:hypothetical protein